MKKLLWLILLLILAGSAVYGYRHYWPSREMTAFNLQQTPTVYHEGRKLDGHNLFQVENGDLLLALSLAEDVSTAHFYWDQPEETLVVTTTEQVFRFQPEQDFYMMNENPIDLRSPLRISGGEPYIPLSFMHDYLQVDGLYRETDQVLVLEEQRSCRWWAEVITEQAVIRQNPDIKAPILEELPAPGDRLLVYATYEHWLRVRTENGMIGYIHKKEVKRFEECRPVERPASDRHRKRTSEVAV